MAARDGAIKKREDLSRFVVHLTRNDTKDIEGGGTEQENFRDIIEERTIGAYSPHCLHADRIPERLQHMFSVSCFTEVPLTQLHLLTKYIRGRNVQLKPYGIVFTREFIINKGAQPAIYINSYGGKSPVREAVDTMFEIAEKRGFKRGKLRNILPFMNAMHERYDFTWEREWRVVGDVKFKPQDVVAVILPEAKEEEWREKFIMRGVPVISPGQTYEEIVYAFSGQQIATKKAWVAKKRAHSSKAGTK